MAAQTSYDLTPAAGREGDLADSSEHEVVPSLANGAVKVGILSELVSPSHTPGDLSCGAVQALAALAVDVDAIITTLASSASAATLSGADLNGAVGAGKMNPARRITVILNSHANWDAGTWTLKGLDVNGDPIQENFLVADAGNATYTSHKFYSYVTSLYVPAQSGTGGSMTVGITADEGMYAPGSVGVAMRDNSREPLTSDSYADEEDVPLVMCGRLLAIPEADVKRGYRVWVRTAASGGDVRGQFRGSPATGFSLLPNARWDSDGVADGLAWLKLGE